MSPRSRLFRRTVLSASLTAAAATAAVVVPFNAAHADPVPEGNVLGTIHPGISTVTNDTAACTSNFVFTDAKGHAYIGQAAHCSGMGGPNDVNGCDTASLPLGTPVALGASGVTGKIAYTSWIAMQKVGETDENACRFNDFSLIRIPDSALEQVNSSFPVFGGPMGVRSTPFEGGEMVLSYGSSPLRGGIEFLSPKQGVTLGTGGEGWTHDVYTATPGVPGDSGSGYIDEEGRAFGVLSTIAFAPLPASNGVADLGKSLDYAQKHSGIKGLKLADGTDSFTPGAFPLLAGVTGGLPVG